MWFTEKLSNLIVIAQLLYIATWWILIDTSDYLLVSSNVVACIDTGHGLNTDT